MPLQVLHRCSKTSVCKTLISSCSIIKASLSEHILNSELEISESKFNIEFLAGQKDLEFLLNLNEKIKVIVNKIEYNNIELIFAGYLLPEFSTDLADPVKIGLLISDQSSALDFEAKKEFIPYTEKKEPFFLLNYLNKEKSLMHCISNFFKLDLNLQAIALKEQTFSFVIKEGDNVLKKLKQLFREFNYTFFFNSLGVFCLLKIDEALQSAENPKEVICFDKNSLNLTKNVKVHDNLKISFSYSRFKSRETLKIEEKDLASKIPKVVVEETQGEGDQKEFLTRIDPFLILQKDEVYPFGSDKTPEWTNFGKGFLVSSLKFVKDTKSWVGYLREEKELALIATFNHEFIYSAEQGVDVKPYFSSDTYCLSFKNKAAKPRNVFSFSVYGDTIYRNSKTEYFREERQKNTSATREIFLEFVNEAQHASSYYNLAQSFLDFGNILLSFRTNEKLSLGSTVLLKFSNIGLSFNCFLTSRTTDCTEKAEQGGVIFYQYEGINFSKIESYEISKNSYFSEEIQRQTVLTVFIADIYQGLKISGLHETDYLNDNEIFVSATTLSETYPLMKIVICANSVFCLRSSFSFSASINIIFEENLSIFKPQLADLNFSEKFRNVVNFSGIKKVKTNSLVSKVSLETINKLKTKKQKMFILS